MIVVDNSILAAVQRCETEAALRYGLGYAAAEEGAPLRAGSAVHVAFATWFTSGGDAAAALAALERDYRPWAEEHVVDPSDRLAWSNVRNCMRQWFAAHTIERFPVRLAPTLIEVGFALPLADDVIVVGRMDGLGQDSQAAWAVVDHKSTGQLGERWRLQHRVSAQLTGYVWAAQHYVKGTVVGAYVNGIELSKLPSDPARRCREHGVPYAECGPIKHARFEVLVTQRPPHLQEEWKATALSLARRYAQIRETVKSVKDIGKVRAEGQFTGACANCQFRVYCGEGRPIQAVRVDTLLRVEPWEPYEHAFKAGGDKGKGNG